MEQEIKNEQLKKFLEEQSSTLVYKVLKRLEQSNVHNPYIKTAVKEIIHEEYREFPQRLTAFIYGHDSFRFEFLKPKSPKK